MCPTDDQVIEEAQEAVADLGKEDLEEKDDSVEEVDSKDLEELEAEFEGVDKVEDIPKGKEKSYGI